MGFEKLEVGPVSGLLAQQDLIDMKKARVTAAFYAYSYRVGHSFFHLKNPHPVPILLIPSEEPFLVAPLVFTIVYSTQAITSKPRSQKEPQQAVYDWEIWEKAWIMCLLW